MALFKSQVLTQASGSVGGMTYTRTRSGLTIRARSIPVQPVSPARDAVQASMATLSNRWSNILTDAQRSAWSVWAASSPYVNKLGDPLILSGQQAFIANNSPRLQGAFNIIDAAPPIFGLGNLSAVTVTAAALASALTVNFVNTDNAFQNTDGGLLVYVTPPLPAARNFIKGPYRYAGKVAGAAILPTSPATLTSPFTMTGGQKIAWRAYAVQDNGQLTNVYSGQTLAV